MIFYCSNRGEIKLRGYILTLFFCLSAATGFGCVCEDVSMNEIIHQVPVILIGRVERILIPGAPEVEKEMNKLGRKGDNARLKILESWKGVDNMEFVNVYQKSGNCNIRLELGTEYLLFCIEIGDQLVTNVCLGTVENTNRDDLLALLGSGQKHNSKITMASWNKLMMFLIMVVGLIAAIGLGLMLRKTSFTSAKKTRSRYCYL